MLAQCCSHRQLPNLLNYRNIDSSRTLWRTLHIELYILTLTKLVSSIKIRVMNKNIIIVSLNTDKAEAAV